MNHIVPKLFLTFVLAGTVATIGCERAGNLPAELQRDIGTVSLEFNFGGQQPDKQVDAVCSPNSTVLLSLERAQQTGDLAFKSTGSGETSFVHSIDGLDNETDGQCWIYKLNDRLGDKSAGIQKVKPGDVVTWSYGTPPAELH